MSPGEDDDLESVLRRYEPAAPPASLRSRVIAASVRGPRAWPWAVAAAALLAMTIGLRAASRAEAVWLDVPGLSQPERDLAEMLGGSDDARWMARWIVASEAAQRAAGPVGTGGNVDALGVQR